MQGLGGVLSARERGHAARAQGGPAVERPERLLHPALRSGPIAEHDGPHHDPAVSKSQEVRTAELSVPLLPRVHAALLVGSSKHLKCCACTI